MATTYVIKLASLKAIANIDLADIRSEVRMEQQKAMTAMDVGKNAFAITFGDRWPAAETY